MIKSDGDNEPSLRIFPNVKTSNPDAEKPAALILDWTVALEYEINKARAVCEANGEIQEVRIHASIFGKEDIPDFDGGDDLMVKVTSGAPLYDIAREAESFLGLRFDAIAVIMRAAGI